MSESPNDATPAAASSQPSRDVGQATSQPSIEVKRSAPDWLAALGVPHPPENPPQHSPIPAAEAEAHKGATRSRYWTLQPDDIAQFMPPAPKLLAEQVKAIEKRVADRIMNELRSRRAIDTDESSESSDSQDAVPTLSEEQIARILDAMPAEAQKGRKGGGPDPASFRLWLTVASGRYAGAGVGEIAAILGVDEEVVERLTESATFIVFEAEFRNALQAAHGADEIRKKVAVGMNDALDAMSWIVKSRNIDAAAAIVSAAKLFAAMYGQLASNGRATQRMVVAHLNLSPQMSDRIAGAVGRRGA